MKRPRKTSAQEKKVIYFLIFNGRLVPHALSFYIFACKMKNSWYLLEFFRNS